MIRPTLFYISAYLSSTHTHTHTHTSALPVDLDITSVSVLECCDLCFLWTLCRKSRLPKTTGNVSSVQSLSRVRLFATPWTAVCQAFLSFTISQSLLKLIPIELDAIQPSCPLSSPSPLPSVFPSIRVFSSEWVLRIRWPMYWSFIFNISPSNEYSGLSSFRIDWFDFLAVQGTLKSLLQHHSAKASILWHSASFQFLHPYMTTGKNHSFDHSFHYWTNHSWECSWMYKWKRGECLFHLFR